MDLAAASRSRQGPLLAVAALAAAVGAALALTGVLGRLESLSIDTRFAIRGQRPAPSQVAVVAVDDRTFSDLRMQWPFPRSLHARMIDILHAAKARVIAYDVQFTEPSHNEQEDLNLFRAVARAGNMVLATTEVDSAGHAGVLGGEANLRAANAQAAASNLPAESDGVVRRYPRTMLGLPSFAVAAARKTGADPSPRSFEGGSALIDFAGPPGTITTYSFSDVLRRRFPPDAFAGRTVVVGASAATLQDLHLTSTSSGSPMAGPEIQASAIQSAIENNPLRDTAWPWALLAIIVSAAAAPLAAARLRVSHAAAVGAAVLAAYLAVCQLAFDDGAVLPVAAPIAAGILAVVGMVGARYLLAYRERNAFARQLRDSQLELVQRLAIAVESRDAETGEHIYRIGTLCEQLALAIGWSEREAEALRHASVMHDIGKLAIPDSVLLKPGKLTEDEYEHVKTHTTRGAAILSGSHNPLVQMAEEIALSHHERWDGTGYPAGLKGTAIPVAARICSLVDVYDALISNRVYKDAWGIDQVIAEIRRGSGTQFDPELTTAFLAIIEAPRASTAAPHLPDPQPAAGRSRVVVERGPARPWQ